jgi:hypothetical protein
VSTKVSEEEFTQLEAAANKSGLTLSEWCGEAMLAGVNGQKEKSLAFLAYAREGTTDARLSVEVSDVQVHLYGDTAIVTYQKQIKQFQSSESMPAMPGLIDHPLSFMDTFVKRNGQVESSGYRRSVAGASSWTRCIKP